MKADVLRQNFAPGTMEKYGLGSERLRALNPQLVYAMGTGYGSLEGPYKNYLGMDITLQAMSGAMSSTGEEGGPPLKTPAAFVDFLAGSHLYSGIVTALYSREQTGVGATVDISMQDCVFPTLSTVIGSYYSVGHELPRSGSRHPSKAIAPYNVYQALDGHVAIICIREGHWLKMCIFRITQDNGVICAPVQTIPESLEDKHMLARGSLLKRENPDIGEISQFQTPIRFKDISPPEIHDVHGLSQDTNMVLTEMLSLTEADIEVRRSKKVIT